MKTILTAIALMAVTTATAQYCELNNFMHAAAHYNTDLGASVEIGLWPGEDQPWGVLIGVGMKVQNAEEIKATGLQYRGNAYGKVQYRLNRFFQPTVTLGTLDITEMYAAAGMRISVPIGRGQRATMVLEPQYGTRGISLSAGMAISIN